jgi:hypothetical protein
MTRCPTGSKRYSKGRKRVQTDKDGNFRSLFLEQKVQHSFSYTGAKPQKCSTMENLL